MSPLGRYNSHHTILFGVLLLLLSLLSIITPAYSNPTDAWEVFVQNKATPFEALESSWDHDDNNIDYNAMDLGYLEQYWAQTSLAAHAAEIEQDLVAMRAWRMGETSHAAGGGDIPDHFVPLQTRAVPGGICRMFNDPDGDPEVYASDQTSICKDVLGEKVKVYLSPTMKNSTFAQNQFAGMLHPYYTFCGLFCLWQSLTSPLPSITTPFPPCSFFFNALSSTSSLSPTPTQPITTTTPNHPP